MEFLCPVCGRELEKHEKTYSCGEHHSFDIARSGYVNLLPPRGNGHHGDDRLMIRARTAFLNRGYYFPLAERVAALAQESSPEGIIDAGCGEGYYTEIVANRCPGAEIIGLDISRDAAAVAAKRCTGGHFAAASTAAMPLKDNCTDVLLNIFSPFFPKEFARVLKKGGKVIRVIPLEKHLHELRALIYDSPYDNDMPDLSADGFAITGWEELQYRITVGNNEDLMNLFMMTPYYYKTSAADQKKVKNAQQLETQIGFGIAIYKKL